MVSVLVALMFLSPAQQGPATPQETFYEAVLRKNVARAEACLDQHVNPNLVGWNGASPLHIAAESGDVAMVRLLLHHGAHVDQPIPLWARDTADSLGNSCVPGDTPLALAAHGGHRGAMKVLLSSRANPRSTDMYGWMPIHSAAQEGHLLAIRILVRYGAGVDDRTGGLGFTPLMLAAGGGHNRVALWLLKHGAKVNAQDREGASPVYWADFHRYWDTAALLEKFGGRYHHANYDDPRGTRQRSG